MLIWGLFKASSNCIFFQLFTVEKCLHHIFPMIFSKEIYCISNTFNSLTQPALEESFYIQRNLRASFVCFVGPPEHNGKWKQRSVLSLPWLLFFKTTILYWSVLNDKHKCVGKTQSLLTFSNYFYMALAVLYKKNIVQLFFFSFFFSFSFFLNTPTSSSRKAALHNHRF